MSGRSRDSKADPNSDLELLKNIEELEFEDVDLDIGTLRISLKPKLVTRTVAPPKVVTSKAKRIIEVEFSPPVGEYLGRIVEVKLGATKGEGGTRGKSITLGGEKAPAWCMFEAPPPNRPVVSMDIFDMAIPLPKAIKAHFEDVINDPAEWAKRAVNKFGADLVTVHLVSTDPLLKDASPSEAASTVERVLQAVDVPIVVGGSGDPKKDLEVFEKVAEVAEGERLLVSTVTLDMDVGKTAEIVKKHGHALLAFTPMDLNKARELNRKLYDFLPKEQIVMDTTMAALGYGIDYAFTVAERSRLAGLMGDRELQHPISLGTTNAWAAREAWMDMDAFWGPKDLRGPIWEVTSALTVLFAGVNLLMMLHPTAVKTVKGIIEALTHRGKPEVHDWTKLKL